MSKSTPIIWSLPTRVIHWTIAAISLLNIYVLEEGDPPHRYLGYLILIALVWRIYLGVRGKEHERFRSFPMSFSSMKSFVQNYFKSRSDRYAGHNPLASWAYIIIWINFVGLGISGWMMGLDAFWGDETLEAIHSYQSIGLKVLVILHLLGMTLDGFKFKRKTWMAMIRGYK